MAKKRLKTAAVDFSVPQSKDQANEFISDIGRMQRERERLQADMNDQISVIKEKFEAEAIPLGEKIRQMTAGVQVWCEANRAMLTEEGKRKHAVLASGKVSWRTRPPRVVLRGKEAIIEALNVLGLKRFLRVSEDVNKEAMLADPEAARQVPGVTIVQTEDFVVTPHETELEEIA